MSRYNSHHPVTHSAILYKIGIALAAVAIIVYFFPREKAYNYQFDLHRPWKYGQLIATFDFPIYKDEATVKEEQDSALSKYQPYFQKNDILGNNKIKELKNNYSDGQLGTFIPNIQYLYHIERLLQQIYRQGIIGNEDLARLHADSLGAIMIVENTSASSIPIADLLTEKEAYEKLIEADTARYKRQILQQCNLHEYLTPNIVYDQIKSETAKNDLLASISWANGMVLSGQKIIDRGEVIDQHTYNILKSLSIESQKRSETVTQQRLTLSGQIIFVSIFIACFILYLELFRQDYYERNRSMLLLMVLVVLFPVITSLMVSHNVFNVYIVPYAMVPIIVRIFMDSRTAFMVHSVMIMLCSIVLRYPYEFVLVQLTAGVVAIYSLRELSQRSQLLRAALLITVSTILLFFSYELIYEDDFTKFNINMYISLIINGALLLFTYPLLFMLEKAFGFTSNVTLVELSNINNTLLRRMSEVAPGTFNHSLQVANLTAIAARAIGANSQLVRTGALYHDIGKMENPAFFTENQSGVNPHSTLPYTESAQIIINHVIDGLKLADKYNVPQVIKNFISTHHGLGRTKYFYILYKNEHPNEEISESLFAYPGPNPSTREEAILMMADSVEAASRSLPEYTEETIGQLVEKIIESQVLDGSFRNCPITFKDIENIKAVFKERLKTVYHTRISYPELKKK